MKKKMKELFKDKNLRIIIPIIVLLVLMIILFIYFKVYQYNNYRNKNDYTFYQYIEDTKFEFDAIVSLNKKGVIKGFEPTEYKINYDSTPIYYLDKDIDKVIIPSNMIIVLPLKREFQYKIPEFSYIEKVGSIQYITFEDYHKNMDHYVLYDGEDLYFFSDSVSFTLNGEEITLSPLSYIKDTISEFSYYDYETDTFVKIETDEEIVVSNEHYIVNVSNDYVNYLGERLLLTSNFDFLNTLN